MTSRRSRRGARAGCSAGSSPLWGCDDGAGPGPRYQQANASSKAIRRGRHRHRRPPSAGKGPCKRHPRARGAGTSPSRDQGRTVRRRRWISLGSGRSATPHPGRTQPYLDPTRSGETTHPTPFGGTWGWPPTTTTRTSPSNPVRRRSRPAIPPPAVRRGSRSIRAPTGWRGPPTTAKFPDPPHPPGQTSSTPGWCMSTLSRGSTRRRAPADRISRPGSDPILGTRTPRTGRAGPAGRGSPPRAATPGRGPGAIPWPPDRRWPAAPKGAPAPRPRPYSEVRGSQVATLSNKAQGGAGSLRAVRAPGPAKRMPNKAVTRRRRTRRPGPETRPASWTPHPMRRRPRRRSDPATRCTTRTGSGADRNAGATPVVAPLLEEVLLLQLADRNPLGRAIIVAVAVRRTDSMWWHGRRIGPRSTRCRRPGSGPGSAPNESPGGAPRRRSGPAPDGSPGGTASRRRGQSRRCRCRGRPRRRLPSGKEPKAWPRTTSRNSHQRRTPAGHASSQWASGRPLSTSSEEVTFSPINVRPTAGLRLLVRSRPATSRASRWHRGTGISRAVAARTPAPPWTPCQRGRCRRRRPVR